jgi:hypothetical protein
MRLVESGRISLDDPVQTHLPELPLRHAVLEPYALDTAAIRGLIGPVRDFTPLLREMLDPNDGVLSAASKREMLRLQARGRAGIESSVGVGLGLVILMNLSQSPGLSEVAHRICEMLRS